MKQARFHAMALGALLSGAGIAHASILDGSFEQPAVPNGSYTVFVSGAVIGNSSCTTPNQIGCWTVIGPGNVAIVSGSTVDNGISFVAAAGAQWLDLTGNGSNSQSGVEQPFNSVPGRGYKLKFSVGAIGTHSRVQVLIDGQPLAIVTNNQTAGSTFNWKHYTLGFVAANPVTTLGFINLDAASDNQNGLDKVTVSP